MTWNQKDIMDWSLKTFGDISGDPILVSLRMTKESLELVDSMVGGSNSKDLLGEMADIFIVLCQVAEIHEVTLFEITEDSKGFEKFFEEPRNLIEISLFILKNSLSLITSIYNRKTETTVENMANIMNSLLWFQGPLQYNLQEQVDLKMDINAKRKWKESSDGSYQHE